MATTKKTKKKTKPVVRATTTKKKAAGKAAKKTAKVASPRARKSRPPKAGPVNEWMELRRLADSRTRRLRAAGYSEGNAHHRVRRREDQQRRSGSSLRRRHDEEPSHVPVHPEHASSASTRRSTATSRASSITRAIRTAKRSSRADTSGSRRSRPFRRAPRSRTTTSTRTTRSTRPKTISASTVPLRRAELPRHDRGHQEEAQAVSALRALLSGHRRLRGVVSAGGARHGDRGPQLRRLSPRRRRVDARPIRRSRRAPR